MSPKGASAQFGGAGRSRTDDPLLAKQVLYQLSYDPKILLKEHHFEKYIVRSTRTQRFRASDHGGSKLPPSP